MEKEEFLEKIEKSWGDRVAFKMERENNKMYAHFKINNFRSIYVHVFGPNEDKGSQDLKQRAKEFLCHKIWVVFKKLERKKDSRMERKIPLIKEERERFAQIIKMLES